MVREGKGCKSPDSGAGRVSSTERTIAAITRAVSTIFAHHPIYGRKSPTDQWIQSSKSVHSHLGEEAHLGKLEQREKKKIAWCPDMFSHLHALNKLPKWVGLVFAFKAGCNYQGCNKISDLQISLVSTFLSKGWVRMTDCKLSALSWSNTNGSNKVNAMVLPVLTAIYKSCKTWTI